MVEESRFIIIEGRGGRDDEKTEDDKGGAIRKKENEMGIKIFPQGLGNQLSPSFLFEFLSEKH